jgi:hypothetical protein
VEEWYTLVHLYRKLSSFILTVPLSSCPCMHQAKTAKVADGPYLILSKSKSFQKPCA